MRNGVLVGGNWIIDEVKIIDSYPEEEQLVTILEEYSSNGGAAYNVIKGLRKLDVDFPLEAIGLLGQDARGRHIFEDCQQLDINISQLRKVPNANTSYTDVMTVKTTGKRTFFHHRGVNALLDETHFDFSASNCKVFHLGYLLLLDKLDIIKKDGSTGASWILKKAKEEGFITTADIVSEASERFQAVISPSLPFIDYLFINEYEAKKLCGIDTLLPNGEVSVQKCKEAASAIIQQGVQQWVILHFPKGVIAVNKELKTLFQPSLQIPSEEIIGTVGAGDAFAAGVLMGIHNNLVMEESLELGVCVAASSLFQATSSDGILSFDQCIHLTTKYGFYEKE